MTGKSQSHMLDTGRDRMLELHHHPQWVTGTVNTITVLPPLHLRVGLRAVWTHYQTRNFLQVMTETVVLYSIHRGHQTMRHIFCRFELRILLDIVYLYICNLTPALPTVDNIQRGS